MFGRWFNRGKPRIFLGTITVPERTDFKRRFEADDSGADEAAHDALRRSLNEIFTLPLAADVQAPLPSDLVLDVVVPRFQAGQFFAAELGTLLLLLFWRPKVTVTSRLYRLTTNQTQGTYSVTAKMGWWRFLGRLLSWRSLLELQIFDRSDLEQLLCVACVGILKKIQKAV